MKKVLFLFLLMCHFSVSAQDKVDIRSESWYGLMTSGQISKNWSLWLDSHFVPELFFIIRPGITYHSPSNRINITGGYAHLDLTTPFSEGELIRDERRPWMQLVYKFPEKDGGSTGFRFRYDARFRSKFRGNELIDGFDFNHRLRLNNNLRKRIGVSEKLGANFSLSLVQEGLLTLGPDRVDVPLEYRLFTLLGIQKNGVTVSPGYHLRVQSLNSGQNRLIHGFVLWINMNYQFKNIKQRILRDTAGDKI